MADLTEEEVAFIDGLLHVYVEYVYEPEVENARREFFNQRTRALLKEQSKRGRFDVPLYNPDYPPELLDLENIDGKRQRFEQLFDDKDMEYLLPLFKRAELYWDAALEKEKGRLAAVRKVLQQWAAEELQVALPDPKSINFDPEIVDMLPSGQIHIGQQSRYDATAKAQEIDSALDALAEVAEGPDLPALGGGGKAGRRAPRRSAGKRRRIRRSKGTRNKGIGSKGTGSRGTGSAGTRSRPIERRTPSSRVGRTTPPSPPPPPPPKKPPPPKPPEKREPPKGSKHGMWIDLTKDGKTYTPKWIEAPVVPGLKNTVLHPRPASGVSDKAADAYERKVGGGQLCPYVYTGAVNPNGSPHTVQFDGYRNTKQHPRDLLDAKFRTNPHAASIYDPRRANFHRDKLRKVLESQEGARKIAGADTVTWIIKDPKLEGPLKQFFKAEGYHQFRVLTE